MLFFFLFPLLAGSLLGFHGVTVVRRLKTGADPLSAKHHISEKGEEKKKNLSLKCCIASLWLRCHNNKNKEKHELPFHVSLVSSVHQQMRVFFSCEKL